MADESPTENPKPPEPEKSARDQIWELIINSPWEAVEKALPELLKKELNELWQSSGLTNYNPLLLIDPSGTIGEDHADRIYQAIDLFQEPRDIILFVNSPGGSIEPAYLLSKNCRAAAKSQFVTVVPRKAKSAATLICLGSHEIHMGSMSELGPIDPQLGSLPAVALSNALETLAKLVCKHPGSSKMFAEFLGSQLNLGVLGYFERVNESAMQYGTRLLEGKQLGEGFTPETLASHLVNHYKDHSFVIDKDEALKLFGSKIIRTKTKEYDFSNILSRDLGWISRLGQVCHDRRISYIGGFENCVKFERIKKD